MFANKKIGDFQIADLIGEGSSGEVYKCFNMKTEQTYAIKIFPVSLLKSDENLIKQETAAQVIIKNKYVITLIQQFQIQDYYLNLLDWCDSGTLENYWIENNRRITEQNVWAFGKQLVKALKAYQEKEIQYGQFRLSKILIHNNKIRIGDVGLWGKQIQDPNTAAPEMITDNKYSIEGSIFSLGCLTYLMLYGESPFQSGENYLPSIAECIHIDIIEKINFSKNNVNISKVLKDLIGKMLKKNPKERILLSELTKQFRYKESGQILRDLQQQSKSGLESFALEQLSDRKLVSKQPVDMQSSTSLQLFLSQYSTQVNSYFSANESQKQQDSYFRVQYLLKIFDQTLLIKGFEEIQSKINIPLFFLYKKARKEWLLFVKEINEKMMEESIKTQDDFTEQKLKLMLDDMQNKIQLLSKKNPQQQQNSMIDKWKSELTMTYSEKFQEVFQEALKELIQTIKVEINSKIRLPEEKKQILIKLLELQLCLNSDMIVQEKVKKWSEDMKKMNSIQLLNLIIK